MIQIKIENKTNSKNLGQDNFILPNNNNNKNKKIIYDYLALEISDKDNEILKKPTILDTINILKDLIEKILNSNIDYVINRETVSSNSAKNEIKLILRGGDIKDVLDDHYEHTSHLNKKTRSDNLIEAGNSIIKEIMKMNNTRMSSPRTVMSGETNGGFNKSKINKQDSIKKMKLKQEKEMNKLKLKQKNELLKLKNKQKIKIKKQKKHK